MSARPRPMRPAEYAAALRRLDLPIVRAADVFGIGRRQSQRYAAGDAAVPAPVAKLVRLAASRKLSLREVREI